MAATILIAVAILFMQKPSREASGPAAGGSASESSPAKMVSMMSLLTAFRRGGMEALDRQFETAIEKLGPRPNGLSMAELYGDLEG
jgi:hypothetical protein